MSNYIKTNTSFSAVVNSEIKASNWANFQAQHADAADLVALLDAGRDGLTQYKSGFVGSLAQQFDLHGYLTPRQAEALAKFRAPVAFVVDRNSASEFIGSIREVMIETLRLNRVINYRVKPSYTGDDGSRRVYSFSDEKGNEVVYRGFAKTFDGVEQGSAYRVKFTVKDHSTYDGIAQTVIQRPAVLCETEYKPAAKRPSVAVAPVTRVRHAATSKKNKVAS